MALTNYIDRFSNDTGITVNVNAPENISLNREKCVCIIRIIQEALINIFKHANTLSANPEIIKSNEKLIVTISDDGKGFDTKKIEKFPNSENVKIGLITMKERALTVGGNFEVFSEVGKGTKLRITIPF